jgi:hypothetical protein
VILLDSVVFASAYRFSVLFSYHDSDPTYTLSPTVVWTAIEMSTGIVSACLPTLRPVMQWAGRGVGMKGGIFGSSHHQQSASFSKTGDQSANRLRSNPNPTNADFFRLADDGASGRSAEPVLPAAVELRPQHGFQYAVASGPGKTKDEVDSLSSGDDIPLHGIRVQTEFNHSG